MLKFLGTIVFFILPILVFGQNNICLESQDFKIVVLGSSTSAGAGASTSDSAWVNRYRSYLQSINPNNEVVNFGVGGYNTYRIMRTGFVPPPGRPNPDPARNITAAIAETPDAIIVNMPSNDVALGFSFSEQMDNLDSIVELADFNNIPIWICTTQPRNFNDTNQLNLQWEVKDSIYAHFNPYTIDFWTTIALPDYTIDPFYDSGDGVHLNDFGHGLLFQRVVNTNILDSVYTPPSTNDFTILDVDINSSTCGDSSAIFQVVVGNIGIDNFDSTSVHFELTNNTVGSVFNDSLILVTGLASCTTDTITFTASTLDSGSYQLISNVNNMLDVSATNDTLTEVLYASGHPTLTLLGDTLCDPGIADLTAVLSSNDTLFWYDDMASNTPIGFGPYLSTPFIDTTTSFFAQAVRGHLFYVDQLHSSLSSNINWNGTMFNIVGHEDLYIDSFDVKINTLGTQGIEVYYKSGSYQGFELDPNPWSLLGSTTLNVTSDSTWTHVPIGGLFVAQNDTVGIYIQMSDPNSRLSYTSVGSEQVRTTPEMTMISGSGISHNFSNNFYPRDWSGGVYYHHGERPLGDCATDRVEVLALVSEIELNSGNDTIIDILDTLWVTATPEMQSYLWSDGSADSTIEIIAADLGMGIHYIDVYTVDSLNCDHYNQFIVGVADLAHLDEIQEPIDIYPNPTSGWVTIKVKSNAKIDFISADGKLLNVPKIGNDKYDLSRLPNGVYSILITTENGRFAKKIIKTK